MPRVGEKKLPKTLLVHFPPLPAYEHNRVQEEKAICKRTPAVIPHAQMPGAERAVYATRHHHAGSGKLDEVLHCAYETPVSVRSVHLDKHCPGPLVQPVVLLKFGQFRNKLLSILRGYLGDEACPRISVYLAPHAHRQVVVVLGAPPHFVVVLCASGIRAEAHILVPADVVVVVSLSTIRLLFHTELPNLYVANHPEVARVHRDRCSVDKSLAEQELNHHLLHPLPELLHGRNVHILKVIVAKLLVLSN
mmetsp:Transcript_5845/g.20377  ORF Transcript_5845/g.20377 Transcript_5845/m.20377 type:complete len:249 (-) Transcript_5845:1066-1812(-)